MTVPTLRRADFPDDFVWGSATAAYQIEGSPNADGKGASIWDAYVATHGMINDGTTGDIADDHYRRFRDDVRLMAEMGLESYRFSISWPRIQPDGTGPVNPAGIAFYRALCEELRAHGIRPWATLYHWDLPLALEEQGGWLVRQTADRFAEYAGLVAGELGDLVDDWITLNEPWCSSFVGYGSGGQAPGRRLGAEAAKAAHHLLVGHGLAVDAIRAAAPNARVGITLNLSPMHPRTDSAADVDVARALDGVQNRFFLDPVLVGGYPADVVERLGMSEWLGERADEVALIGRPLDFLGVNYYFPVTVAAGGEHDAQDLTFPIGTPVRFFHAAASRTAMGWPVRPDALGEMLRMVTDRKPDIDIHITENGAAFDDLADADGEVRDSERTAYLQAHFAAARAAIAEGARLRGYFVWSFLDNFEWSWGLARRFGIVRVDYATQQRTVKASGRWYADFLRGA